MKLGTVGAWAILWSLGPAVFVSAETIGVAERCEIRDRLVSVEAGVHDFEPARAAAIAGRLERSRIDGDRTHIEFNAAHGQRRGNLERGFVSALQERPAEVKQPPQQATAASASTFMSDAGMVLTFVKADKVADFETVLGKLKEALAKSPKPERRQQAAGWKIFKATETTSTGHALYVYIIDPPVKDADYTVSTILAESLPASESQAVLRMYSDVFAQGQNFLGLTLVSDLGR